MKAGARRRHGVHPWAWWLWALLVAGAVSLTTNPLVIALIAMAVVAVVALRRTNDPWARSVGVYFALAGFIIAFRLVFQVLLGVPLGSTVLFRLPEIALPAWAAGVRLGGAVTAEALLATLYDSLRLVVLLMCLGAANSLANPRRALRVVPGALHEASVAVIIALSVAPQLIESTQRIRRAQRLRGGAGRGWRSVTTVVVPVLTDAIDRSLSLAAGMEARGFASTRTAGRPRPLATLLLVASALALTFGGFLVLSDSQHLPLAASCLVGGLIGLVLGLRLSGRDIHVTHYRPDPWTPRDTLLVLAGLLSLVGMIAVAALAPRVLTPSTLPLDWPAFHPALLVVLVGAVAPLFLTRDPLAPPRPSPAAARSAQPAGASPKEPA